MGWHPKGMLLKGTPGERKLCYTPASNVQHLGSWRLADRQAADGPDGGHRRHCA